MLIHSRNTERVLDTLQRRFGRPSLLVRSQIQRVRDLAPLDENKLEQLDPFATTVQNLATFLDTDATRMHLTT